MMQVFRKYYTPGLISLIFLPLFSYIYLYKYLHPAKNYCITLNWPGQAMQALSPYPFPPIRRYRNIELNGNARADSVTLVSCDTYIRNIISHSDTINGIWVHFNNKVKYQSIVTLLDICQVDGAKIYLWDGANFGIVPVISHHGLGIEIEPIRL